MSSIFLSLPPQTQKARIDAFYKLEKSTKPRVKDPSLELSEEGQRRLGGNILKVSFQSVCTRATPISAIEHDASTDAVVVFQTSNFSLHDIAAEGCELELWREKDSERLFLRF